MTLAAPSPASTDAEAAAPSPAADAAIVVTDPVSGSVASTTRRSTPDEVRDAVARARAAAPGWAGPRRPSGVPHSTARPRSSVSTRRSSPT